MRVKERVEMLAFKINQLVHEERAENFVDNAIKILTVSYTHLDVYKRQGQEPEGMEHYM